MPTLDDMDREQAAIGLSERSSTSLCIDWKRAKVAFSKSDRPTHSHLPIFVNHADTYRLAFELQLGGHSREDVALIAVALIAVAKQLFATGRPSVDDAERLSFLSLLKSNFLYQIFKFTSSLLHSALLLSDLNNNNNYANANIGLRCEYKRLTAFPISERMKVCPLSAASIAGGGEAILTGCFSCSRA